MRGPFGTWARKGRKIAAIGGGALLGLMIIGAMGGEGATPDTDPAGVVQEEKPAKDDAPAKDEQPVTDEAPLEEEAPALTVAQENAIESAESYLEFSLRSPVPA